jgi:pimeloyl-ACP methyl ester carboxylesterase
MHVSIGSIRLCVDVYGSGGSDVLLVHGLGNCRRSWGTTPRKLAVAHRVFAVDLRGAGDSERGDAAYGLDLLADDLAALLDALEIPSCHVVGHSLGGVVTLDLLTRHGGRVKSAVLVSTSSRVGDKATAKWRRLADQVEARGIRVTDRSMRAGFTDAFADRYPKIIEEFASHSAHQDPRVYAQQARAASAYDYTQALGGVEQPVLVMQGLADTMTSPGGSVILARALPHSRLEMIENASHNLHIELGDEFADRLTAFFAEVDAEPSAG